MKKNFLLIAIALLAISTATALDPLKVAIYKPGGAANVQVFINDYTGGTASIKYTGATESLTPNGSGIIIADIIGGTLGTIPASDVNSYYVVDVEVDGNLFAQYRLDQLIITQAQGGVLDSEGNLTPSESGTASIGSDDNRWDGLFVTGNTLHVGPGGGMAGNDELAFSYDDGTNTATMTVATSDILTATATSLTIDGLTVGQGAGNIATNTALGVSALAVNTTGSNNSAIGRDALYSNSTGNSNTAIGRDALYSNSTGNSNTASGQNALFSNTTGSNNSAIGRDALYSNTTGNSNTASGQNALFSNTTGSNNSSSGRDALYSNTTGSNNTANGQNVLFSNTTGSNNTANGKDALYSNKTGSSNTAIGVSALQGNTTGINNTANGVNAGRSITTGSDNTFVGKDAGNGGQLATATNSIAIGASTYTTADNQVVIGNGAVTETLLRGKLQNTVTNATHAQLSTANTSVISYSEATDVASVDLPVAKNGTFLYVHCSLVIGDFLGSAVGANDVVSCVRIAGTWRRVK